MAFAADECRVHLLDPKESVIPKFKTNLHWSVRSPSQVAVCTPLTWAPFIPQGQQRVYIDWVYRYCLHWQGEMIEERYTSWFRNSSENYTPQYDSEFEREPTDDIMRLSSP